MLAATITIKNIPSNLYDLIKKNAARNHRSINNEIISIIENTFLSREISSDDFLAAAKRLRKKTKGHRLTEEFINQAKWEDRL
jgi:plasmid stability protein